MRRSERAGRFAVALLVLAGSASIAACSLVRRVDDLYGGVADAAPSDDASSTCAVDCLGGACVGGVCLPVTLLAPRVSPWGIAVDRGVVYWSELGPNGAPGGAYLLGGDGGPGSPIVTVLQSDIAAQWIAIDAGTLFWASNVSPGAVGRCAIGGSGCLYTPGSVVEPPGSVVASGYATRSYANNPDRAAGDATGIYWTNAGTQGDTMSGSVVFCAAAGCTSPGPTILASSLQRPRGIAVDETYVYWVNEGTSATSPTGSVMRVKKAGISAIQTLASAQADPAYIAVDDANVYWTNRVGGQIMRWSKTGNGPATVLADHQTGAWDIAVDASGVYWTTWGPNGTVARCAKPDCDGGVRVIAASLNQPFGIALDEVSIYFTELDPTNGAILRVAKP